MYVCMYVCMYVYLYYSITPKRKDDQTHKLDHSHPSMVTGTLKLFKIPNSKPKPNHNLVPRNRACKRDTDLTHGLSSCTPDGVAKTLAGSRSGEWPEEQTSCVGGRHNMPPPPQVDL